MKHGSLFSGIGGFDLAAEWMGWDNIFWCEKDPFCQNILKYYWPQSKGYEDIKNMRATDFAGVVDVISGGFPCQPFSYSGRRNGESDDRFLWPEAYRIITEAKPEWIVLENVAGLFTILEQQSLSEMEIREVELFCSDLTYKPTRTVLRIQRRVIGTIISQIGAAGYILPQLEDGTSIVLCIPACAVGAPHQRDRVWFVAHADSLGLQAQRRQKESRKKGAKAAGTIRPQFVQLDWNNWPTQSIVRGRNNGFSDGLDGIAVPKWRTDSIKALGNAIVPQVAFELFKAIDSQTGFNY